MTKIDGFRYKDNWGGVYSLDSVETRNLLRVEPPDFLYAILTRRVKASSIITCGFAKKPQNQRVRVPAGFTINLSPVEREIVAVSVNTESDRAEKLKTIVSTVSI